MQLWNHAYFKLEWNFPYFKVEWILLGLSKSEIWLTLS